MAQATRRLTAVLVSILLSVPALAFEKPLQCAADLMGAAVPRLTVVFVDRQPTPAECRRAGRETCGAVIAPGDKVAVIIMEGSAWPLLVHEACHIVQQSQGRAYHGPAAERECEAIAARASECR